jgi:hypothetical protein
MKLKLGSYGVSIQVTIRDGETFQPVDISTATIKNFIFTTSRGIEKTIAAQFGTDGSDGVLTYVTTPGVIDVSGSWKLSVYIVSDVYNGNSSSMDLYVVD